MLSLKKIIVRCLYPSLTIFDEIGIFNFLSTSLCRNQEIDSSILECGELSNKKVELSAPHPNQSMEEITKIIKKYLNRGYQFTLHNYFPPPEKRRINNIAE